MSPACLVQQPDLHFWQRPGTRRALITRGLHAHTTDDADMTGVPDEEAPETCPIREAAREPSAPLQGPLYASKANADAPSMVVFRPLESWAPNGEWSLALPEGEDVVAVAAGRSFLAAATSARLLRLFSTSGVSSAAGGPGWCPKGLQRHRRLSHLLHLQSEPALALHLVGRCVLAPRVLERLASRQALGLRCPRPARDMLASLAVPKQPHILWCCLHQPPDPHTGKPHPAAAMRAGMQACRPA